MSDDIAGEAQDLIPQAKATRKFKVIDPDTPLEMFNLTPNGNGDRFASRHLGDVLLYSTDRQKVFYTVGEDNRWLKNEGRDAGDLERRCRAVVDEMRDRARELLVEAKQLEDEGADEKAGLLKEMSEHLKKWAGASDNYNAMRTMAMTGCLTYGMVTNPDDDFDADLSLIATPDQVVELRDVVSVRDIQQDDMITYSTSVRYDPAILEHPPALITEFLETFIPEKDKQRLIFKALGSALLGGNANRLLMILQGKSGTNGKTQLVEAIRAALGDYAGVGSPSIFRGNLDDKPRPDVIMLLKKRVAFLSEASKKWELHGDRVKAITGGDGFPVRRMRSDDVMQVVPQFTPVIVTNDMPHISDVDKPTRRRMLVVEFNRRPVKEDPTIKQRFLKSEDVHKWLLAALVQGYAQVAAEGIEDVLNEYALFTETAFEETSHMGEFFEWLIDNELLSTMGAEEMAVYGAKSKYVTLKSFHDMYSYWVTAHGSKTTQSAKLDYSAFNKQLKDMYGWTVIHVSTKRWEGRVLKQSIAAFS